MSIIAACLETLEFTSNKTFETHNRTSLFPSVLIKTLGVYYVYVSKIQDITFGMFQHDPGRSDVVGSTNMMIYLGQLLCHIVQFVLTKS